MHLRCNFNTAGRKCRAKSEYLCTNDTWVCAAATSFVWFVGAFEINLLPLLARKVAHCRAARTVIIYMENAFNPADLPRRLPCGMQSFLKIRKEGYPYVDKTDLVWRMAHGFQYNYFSRPRRFGKSLLVDTLQCYFEGRRELFEGLKIMKQETEWKQYPVLHFDLSVAGYDAATMRSYFNTRFSAYEQKYNLPTEEGRALSDRFTRILHAAYEATGLGVVVLIDEYDCPLQHAWRTNDYEACRRIYPEVFNVLKAESGVLRFVFITGVAKFTQLSLFSALNNLSILSFDEEYATLCGITEQELKDNFMPELERMAKCHGWTLEQTLDRLRAKYDGYRFTARSPVGVYNPFGLLNALQTSELRCYWAASGATTMLLNFVSDLDERLYNLEDCAIDRDVMETADINADVVELFFYQSGYLTIKGADDFCYMLTIPNGEVRQALYNVVLPALAAQRANKVRPAQALVASNLSRGNVDAAMTTLKALIADAPYGNKKLESIDMEERYRFLISATLFAAGVPTEVEHIKSRGRIDIVSRSSRYIYVFELKLTKNGGLAAAERQILEKGYADPFLADPEGREVVAVAVELQDEGKGILGWKRVAV